MDQALDTLAASRKLEQSGMPEQQAEAVAEVVNDAMTSLVTKEYLRAELDRSTNELKLSIAHLGRAVAWGFASMCVFAIALTTLLFAALQFFDMAPK